MTRPFGIIAATQYAIRAAKAHYRFARTNPMLDVFPEGIGLVVSSREPTHNEMSEVGSRWSDWSRLQGKQPVDPATIWSDVATLWRAIHSARAARKSA